MITLQKLKERALKALYNLEEVENANEFVDKAVADALDISKGRAVIEHFVEDYAYIRLKIYLKIELSEEDELLYKEALKAIKEADLIDDSGDIKPRHIIKVATKQSVLG